VGSSAFTSTSLMVSQWAKGQVATGIRCRRRSWEDGLNEPLPSLTTLALKPHLMSGFLSTNTILDTCLLYYRTFSYINNDVGPGKIGRFPHPPTYVCTYLCMFLCIYLPMYVPMYVPTYVCSYVCTYLCMFLSL
jgi:hypothetical protein